MIEYSVILIIPERNLYMKIVVTGSEGMLGRDVVTALKERGHEVVGCDLPEYDVTDRIGIQQFRHQAECLGSRSQVAEAKFQLQTGRSWQE